MKRGHIITIGSFDGVHRGHQALLERTRQEANKRHVKTMALTFAIPPKMILDPNLALRLLSTSVEKQYLLEKQGIDKVVFWSFDSHISTMRPFAFVKNILIQHHNAKGIVVGSDFRFGADRSAGVHELVRWGLEFEIPVWVIAPVKRNRHVISSSAIRHLLETHKLRQANSLLGHPYLISGRVASGRKLGRKIGFPTANLDVAPGKILPKGVYAVKAWLQDKPGRAYGGVCNIGVKPTVIATGKVSVEVHLFDFNKTINGKTLLVELHHFLRSEKKFASVEELRRQISRDSSNARRRLRS